MIWAALFERAFLGLKGWVWAVGAIALVIAGVLWLRAQEAADDRTNQAIGATKAINEGHESTLDQLEKANEAEDDIRFDRSGARYFACLRDVAPGYEAGCERYRPYE